METVDSSKPFPFTGITQKELSFLNESEPIALRYVLVDDVVLLEDNPKLHDSGLIEESIRENGFRDPPAWDSNLNGGKGGIVEGNGRSEALKRMQDQGQPLPRGIALTADGRWAMPLIFGCDSASEAMARRYALDHNNLTMAGGLFSVEEVSRMYNAELYANYLEDLQKEQSLPLTVTAEDIGLLMDLHKNESIGDVYEDEEIDYERAWDGMPEFDQRQSTGATISIRVNFYSINDLEKFALLIGQKITEKTKWINFPYREPEDLTKYKCVEE